MPRNNDPDKPPVTLPDVTIDMVINALPAIRKVGSTYIGGSTKYITFADYQAASGGRSLGQVLNENNYNEKVVIARLLMTMLREN